MKCCPKCSDDRGYTVPASANVTAISTWDKSMEEGGEIREPVDDGGLHSFWDEATCANCGWRFKIDAKRAPRQAVRVSMCERCDAMAKTCELIVAEDGRTVCDDCACIIHDQAVEGGGTA